MMENRSNFETNVHMAKQWNRPKTTCVSHAGNIITQYISQITKINTATFYCPTSGTWSGWHKSTWGNIKCGRSLTGPSPQPWHGLRPPPLGRHRCAPVLPARSLWGQDSAAHSDRSPVQLSKHFAPSPMQPECRKSQMMSVEKGTVLVCSGVLRTLWLLGFV